MSKDLNMPKCFRRMFHVHRFSTWLGWVRYGGLRWVKVSPICDHLNPIQLLHTNQVLSTTFHIVEWIKFVVGRKYVLVFVLSCALQCITLLSSSLVLSADARWCIRQQKLGVYLLVPPPLSHIPFHRVGSSLSNHNGLFDATHGQSGHIHQKVHLAPIDSMISLCDMISECWRMHLWHWDFLSESGVFLLYNQGHVFHVLSPSTKYSPILVCLDCGAVFARDLVHCPCILLWSMFVFGVYQHPLYGLVGCHGATL